MALSVIGVMWFPYINMAYVSLNSNAERLNRNAIVMWFPCINMDYVSCTSNAERLNRNAIYTKNAFPKRE